MTASVIGALRVNLGLDSAAFSSGLRGASKNMATFQSAMQGMAAKVAAALGGMMAVRAAGAMADEWSDLQSKVGAAIGSMEQAPAVMGRLLDLANASYSPLAQTADGFARNVGALRSLGLGTQQAIDYTEALNHALVITATRGDRAASVQDALSKAMATGKLEADGLETVLANGGRVAQALASELGTNVSGLRAFASEGKITGSVIAAALTGRLADLRAEAAEMPATMADGFTRIRNNLTAFIGQLDQALGVSSAVASGLMLVGDNLSLIAGFASAAGIAVAATYVPALWSAVTALAAATAGTKIFGAALLSLRGALYATGIGVFIATAGTLIWAFLELVRATGGFGAALKAMGELGGLVWRGLVDSAKAIPPGLASLWGYVKADFFEMVADLQETWSEFLRQMSVGISFIPGMEGLSSDIYDSYVSAEEAHGRMLIGIAGVRGEAASKEAEAAAIIANAWAPVGEKFAELTAITEDFETSLSSLGDTITGGGAGGTGGGGSGTADTWWRDLVDGVMEAQMQRTADAIDRGADAMTNFLGSIMDGSKTAMQALGDLAKMMSQAYLQRAVLGFGQTGIGGSILGALGMAVGTNANGTNGWRGGLTAIHERGGEIMNLPRGTQIIPNDISKRMADAAGKSAAGGGHMSIGFDASTGSLTATMYDVAGQVVARESSAIVGQSVSAVQRGSRKTSRFLGA